MRASVVGLGEWLPESVRSNDAWPRQFASAAREGRDSSDGGDVLTDVTAGVSGDACDRIVARYVASEAGDPFVGSRRRRIADETCTAVEAETRAARAAIDDARIDPKDIGLVLSFASVPDRITPAGGTRIAYEVGATNALAMGVDAACASAIAQIELAAAMIESGRVRYALLTQSHLMTRAFPMIHPASPNVGDAATAIVVGATEKRGIVATRCVSQGEYYDAVVWRRRAREGAARWFEAGGSTYLWSYDPEGARALIQNTVRIGADTVRELMHSARIDVSRIGAFAAVQPRKWIPMAIAETLGLRNPSEIAPNTFEEHAHLGGCGVVVNLIEARRRGLLAPGTLVALYGQGAGFTRAAALLEWN